MLLGIVGKARSGKDTFAEMLAEELGKKIHPPFVLMAFAQELKLGCQKAFDLSYEQLWGDEKEKEDKRYPKRGKEGYWTGREIMQSYGEFYRTIDYDFWVNYLFKVIDEKEYKNIIITDVRHVNEADAVLDHGGQLIRVVRENAPVIHGNQHVSETALDNYKRFDFNVINNYGLKELRAAASEVAYLLSKSNISKKIVKE